MAHVFLSYSRDDRRIMEPLRDYLRGRGIDVWTDEHLTPGTTNWQTGIERNIREAGAMVVLMSPSSNQETSYVRNEITYALLHKIEIFPVLIAGDEASAIPSPLVNYQYIDIRGRMQQTADEAYHRLAQILGNKLDVRLRELTSQINVTINGDVYGDVSVAARDIVEGDILAGDQPPPSPATAPQLTLEGPDANHTLLLEWSSVENAIGYTLEESTKPDFRQSIPIRMGSRTWHTLLRREPGLYYYRACGENMGGQGPWSEPVEAIVRPGRPAWIEVKVPDKTRLRVEVSWDAVPGQVSYELEFLAGATDPESDDWSEARVPYQGREPASTLRVAKEVRDFAFRVRATHPDGGFGEWCYSQALSRIGPPDTPQLREPTLQPSGEVLIRWNDVAEATEYEIEHARDGTFADARTYVTDRLRFLFKPQSREPSWFRVRACNDHGCSDPSQAVQVLGTHLPKPKLLPVEARPTSGSLKITWTEVQDAAQYEIQVATDISFQSVEQHIVDAPQHELTLQGYESGPVYVRVGAIGADWHLSEWSEVLTIELGTSGP